MSNSQSFLPVSSYFPGRSARWIADSCRAGRIKGAVKVGGSWFLREAEADALVGGASVSAEEAALADLRKRGVCR